MGLEKQDLDTQFGVNSAPFVAIWMVAYNHENYINEAVESVMMQETDFEYKLFIGEDCSSDRTREICVRLKEKYPEKIELFLNKTNLGSKCNAEQIYKACFESRAKYIALCEGDDYWTDPLKLQKQVDYLENNNEIVFCFHGAKTVDDHNNFNVYYKSKFFKHKQIVSKKHFISKGGACFCTASVFFRREMIDTIPDYFKNCFVGDFPLGLLAISNGEIGYLEDEMAVYRVMADNSWSANVDRDLAYKVRKIENSFMTMSDFNEFTNHQFSSIIENLKSLCSYQLLISYFGVIKSKRDRFIKYKQYRSELNFKHHLKVLIKLFL